MNHPKYYTINYNGLMLSLTLQEMITLRNLLTSKIEIEQKPVLDWLKGRAENPFK